MFNKQTVALKEDGQQMEKEKKNKKMKEKQSSQRRSPLQELKRIPKRNNRSISSSSTSVSIEAPKGCLRFLLSSNSNSSSSSSSSYSRRPNIERKPKSLSRISSKPLSTTPKSAPNSTRLRSKPSKENDLPRDTSQKPRKNPSFLYQWQSGKKSSSKIAQRSKLSSDASCSVKNSASGSERYGVNRKDLKQENEGSGEPTKLFNLKVADDLNKIENCTPVGKLVCGSRLNSAIFFDEPVGEDSNSANTIVKTPPIEASVSPEIQYGAANVVVSAAKHVCYGAGHLLSGTTDKRKCRPRGVLIIGGDMDSLGCGKIAVCEDESNEIANEVIGKSRPSFVPLPAEATMKWLLSPHGGDEKEEVQEGDIEDQCLTILSSASVGIPSSPSTSCRVPSNFFSGSGDNSNSVNWDDTTSTGKTRIVLLSPRRIPNFQGISGASSEKLSRDSSLSTPKAKSDFEAVCLQKGDFNYKSTGKKSPLYTGSLGCGNVVQTPKSESSPDSHAGISWTSADGCQRNEFDLKLDSIAEIFPRTSLSPRSPMLDPPGFSSKFSNLTSPSQPSSLSQIQNKLDNCASWISDSTLENVSLSQMRISWREGLVSRIFDKNEFDCCRCLSDEESNDEKADKPDFESAAIGKQNAFENDVLRSPDFLEQEPSIPGKGKERLTQEGPKISAESISIDGSSLFASGDSDWNFCYKNQLFKI